MKTYKRTLLVRNDTLTDAIDIVLETDGGDILLRIPAELLNNAITGLFAGAHALSKHQPPAALQPNQATIAAPFPVQAVSTHAEGPEESVLTVQCGPATLAIHMSAKALAAAARVLESNAATLADANQRPH